MLNGRPAQNMEPYALPVEEESSGLPLLKFMPGFNPGIVSPKMPSDVSQGSSSLTGISPRMEFLPSMPYITQGVIS